MINFDDVVKENIKKIVQKIKIAQKFVTIHTKY